METSSTSSSRDLLAALDRTSTRPVETYAGACVATRYEVAGPVKWSAASG